MSSDLALSARDFQRAAAGTTTPPTGCSCEASEMYFRNTRPRMTSLYWLADSEPRSLSAAFQSVSLSSFELEGVGPISRLAWLQCAAPRPDPPGRTPRPRPVRARTPSTPARRPARRLLG